MNTRRHATPKIASMLTLLACAALFAGPASAATVTRSTTTTPDGSIVQRKTVTTNDTAYVAPVPAATVQTTTTRTTQTKQWSPAAAPLPVASTSTTTTTTTEHPQVYTTYDTYAYDNDDSEQMRDNRRIGGTYAIGEDRQGNNVMRYGNKTFDGYND